LLRGAEPSTKLLHQASFNTKCGTYTPYTQVLIVPPTPMQIVLFNTPTINVDTNDKHPNKWVKGEKENQTLKYSTNHPTILFNVEFKHSIMPDPDHTTTL